MEFLTNASVALFAAGAVAPMFTKPEGLGAVWPYFLAITTTIVFILFAGYIEEKR